MNEIHIRNIGQVEYRVYFHIYVEVTKVTQKDL